MQLNESALIESIKRAFGSEFMPSADNLISSHGRQNITQSRYEWILATYATKKWEDITFAIIDEKWDVLWEFTPEAFIYYMAAYMTVILQNSEELLENYIFTDAFILHTLLPNTMELNTRVWLKEIFSKYTAQQKQVILNFVLFIAEINPEFMDSQKLQLAKNYYGI